MILAALPTWLGLHEGPWYNFWSGILGAVEGAGIFASVTVGLSAWWSKHNCHVHRCWRVSWHPHPDHGHPVCKRHHPEHPRGGGKRITEGGDLA